MKLPVGRADFALIFGIIAILITIFQNSIPVQTKQDANISEKLHFQEPEIDLKEEVRIPESGTVEGYEDVISLQAIVDSLAARINIADDDAEENHQGYESVLKIFVTYVKPSFVEPWKSDSPESISGSGFPIVFQGKKYVVTNSHVAEFGADIRVRKPASSIKYAASLVVESKDLDLAILSVKSEKFWSGLDPLILQTEVPELAETVTVIGYPEGDDALCLTKGVVSRVKMAFARSASVSNIQIDAAINSGNSGGPVLSTATGHVIGVATSKLLNTDNIGFIVASRHIVQLLEDFYQHGKFQGLPSLSARIGKLENTAHRRFLKIPEDITHGIRVVEAWDLGTVGKTLQKDDILLKIDGVEIGMDGTVPIDSQGESSQRLDLSWLYSSKRCGETIKIEFMRGGKIHNAEVELKTTQFEIKSEYCRDHGNKYYVFGGFVFGVLSYEAVQDTEEANEYAYQTMYSRFPDRYDFAEKDGHESVVVLQILHHEVNHGYTDLEMRKIESINGVEPTSFEHAVNLLQKDETITIDFYKNKVTVFDRDEALASNKAVMKTFNIPQSSRLDFNCD